MSQKLILSGHQAKAVADAMCALNNVGGSVRIYMEGIRVFELYGSPGVGVHAKGKDEYYETQSEFFAAYSELMDAAK